ncbi:MULTISPECIES: hypothetical protein [unclassified Microbacterium]|uniref:hypothetical protein n=1 Tax=unclassified Microbacterium TaxID=2609290 RepID=UPI003018BEC3
MTDDVKDDDLAALPAERLAEMLREKRRAEATVRSRLREVETERDALSERVTAWQGDRFAALAKDGRVVESAVKDVAALVPLESVLDDAGLVDAEKVSEALIALRQERPHLFQRVGASGPDSFGGAQGVPQSVSWSDVLR